jgi:hypothetical protein
VRAILCARAYKPETATIGAKMVLFKSNPEKMLIRDIAAATASRDTITARLADAEAAVAELKMKAERLALEGADDAALDAAEAKTRALTDRVATLRAALTQTESRLAGLERERADQADKKLRAATAAEVAAMADDLEATATSFDSSVEKMAEITGRASLFVYEAMGLKHFAATARMQVPDATALIAALLRSHAANVLAGSAPPTLPKPDAPFVEPEPVRLEQVFCLHAIQWTDHHGVLRRIGKWNDVELPAEAAERALRLGICAPMSDPRRAKLKGYGGGHPEPHWCKNLDAEPDDAVALEQTGQRSDPVEHSPFTVIDRGPGYTLRVAR